MSYKSAKKQKISREYEFEKYSCSFDTLMSTLESYGVAILPKILSKEECDEMNKGVWDYLEHITQVSTCPIQRNNKSSWTTYYKLKPIDGMLMHNYNIGHSQYTWNVRQNQKVIDVFSKIYNTDDLLTSFDGASFNIPPEETGFGWNNNTYNFYTDQSFCRNDFECVQSWITSNDVKEGDATLTFLEGSHKLRNEVKKMFNIDSSEDHHTFDNEELDFYKDNGCNQKYIKCPTGSMVLWDSRTVHCESMPFKWRSLKNFRNVVLVCMQPKQLCDEILIKKRINAFESLKTTSHWVSHLSTFAEGQQEINSGLAQIKITKINKPILTERGVKLVGY